MIVQENKKTLCKKKLLNRKNPLALYNIPAIFLLFKTGILIQILEGALLIHSYCIYMLCYIYCASKVGSRAGLRNAAPIYKYSLCLYYNIFVYYNHPFTYLLPLAYKHYAIMVPNTRTRTAAKKRAPSKAKSRNVASKTAMPVPSPRTPSVERPTHRVPKTGEMIDNTPSKSVGSHRPGPVERYLYQLSPSTLYLYSRCSESVLLLAALHRAVLPVLSETPVQQAQAVSSPGATIVYVNF
jgi:hypothetical protein